MCTLCSARHLLYCIDHCTGVCLDHAASGIAAGATATCMLYAATVVGLCMCVIICNRQARSSALTPRLSTKIDRLHSSAAHPGCANSSQHQALWLRTSRAAVSRLLHFLQEFVPVARELEKNWTRFSPHYIVWVCPRVYRQSAECQSQCIHHGRYCTPDPDGDLENGYSGADVVQVCIPSHPPQQSCVSGSTFQ